MNYFKNDGPYFVYDKTDRNTGGSSFFDFMTDGFFPNVHTFIVESDFDKLAKDKKNYHKMVGKNIVLPKIYHEAKNDVYVAKFPDGSKEVDILKPSNGDEYDLEKGLLYYVIKHNLDLGEVLEWMRPILDESKRPENIEKRKKEIEAKINKWFMSKSYEPLNDKDCQKIVNNKEFVIDSEDYRIIVSIAKNGIISVRDKKNATSIKMIKPGFPYKGFLRHLIYKLFNDGKPTLEYFQLKKLTYKFYQGCFDSVEAENASGECESCKIS